MRIWQKFSSRLRGHSEEGSRRSSAESPEGSPRLARDKALEEQRRSAVGPPLFSQDAAAVEEDE